MTLTFERDGVVHRVLYSEVSHCGTRERWPYPTAICGASYEGVEGTVNQPVTCAKCGEGPFAGR